MATRFYFTDITAGEPKPNSGWFDTRQVISMSYGGGQDATNSAGTIYPLLMSETPGSNARTASVTLTEPGTPHYVRVKTWMSPPLKAQTLSSWNFTYVADYAEGNSNQNMLPSVQIMVWKAADTVGPTLSGLYTSTEANSTLGTLETFWSNRTLSNVTVSDGDKLAVFVTAYDNNSKTAAYAHEFSFNGTVGSGNETYIEFSSDLTTLPEPKTLVFKYKIINKIQNVLNTFYQIRKRVKSENRKSHVISQTTGAGTGYQIKLNVYYSGGTDSGDTVYLNGKCKTDFSDIYFADSSLNELSFWRESYIDSTSAVFWVKINDNLDSADSTLFIIYGDSSRTYSGSGAGTFELFDGFDDSSVNTSLWDTSGTITENTTEINVSGNPAWIRSKTSFGLGYAYRTRAKDSDVGGRMSINWTNDDATSLSRWLTNEGLTPEKLWTQIVEATSLVDRDINDIHNYHIFEVRRIATNNTDFLYDDTVYHDTSPGAASENLKFQFYIWQAAGAFDGQLDWIAVRKCISSEPAHGAWGTEIVGKLTMGFIYSILAASSIVVNNIMRGIYNIRTLISSNKRYYYHLRNYVSSAKTSLYNIFNRITSSKLYIYTIRNIIQSSKSFIYNIGGKVNRALASVYNIFNRASSSDSFSYNVRGFISSTKKSIYNVLNRVSSTKTFLWNIGGKITKALTYVYNILSRVSSSKNYLYSIRNYVSSAKKYVYNILGRISSDKVYIYNIMGRIQSTKNFIYNISGKLIKTLNSIYNILGKVSASRVAIYNILTRIVSTDTYSYHIKNFVSSSKKAVYNIINRIQSAKLFIYNISQKPIASLKAFYNIRVRVSISEGYIYSIRSIISVSRKMVYNISNFVSSSKKSIYNIYNRIQSSKNYLYNIGGKITKALVSLYNIMGRVSSTDTYSYMLKGFVSSSKKAIYNIRGYVSSAKTMIYNILGKPSAALRALYNIRNRVSSGQTYPYVIRGIISSAKKFVYFINTSVSSSKKAIYNIRGYVQSSKIFVYGIGGRIWAALKSVYNIRTTISANRVYVYFINKSVSASKTISYNIRGFVSSTKKHIYNIRGYVVSSMKSVYNIRSIVQKMITGLYRINNYCTKSLKSVYSIITTVFATGVKNFVYNIGGRVSNAARFGYKILAPTQPELIGPYYTLLNELYTHLNSMTTAGGQLGGFRIYRSKPRTVGLHFPCVVLDIDRTSDKDMFGKEYIETATVTVELMFTKKHYKIIDGKYVMEKELARYYKERLVDIIKSYSSSTIRVADVQTTATVYGPRVPQHTIWGVIVILQFSFKGGDLNWLIQ